ncbi:unnamed protein product [Miscanthus lutarioriparius]|uniref:Uncharacterized protein n=1 Tax=Miscanthus lutarioriparius TaxID=422564 RepID=A0A811NLX6_9POAL|nr:unnamed protein product [Miscanthus lutarioriparius]
MGLPHLTREKQAGVEHWQQGSQITEGDGEEPPAGDDHGVRAHPSLFEVAMFEEDYHDYPDWTNSLFDDDHCYKNEEDVDDDDHDDLDILDALDEPSVIEIIRTKREVEGLEFNMDDDIDEACDMFIRRFRSRMNRSFSDFCIRE